MTDADGRTAIALVDDHLLHLSTLEDLNGSDFATSADLKSRSVCFRVDKAQDMISGEGPHKGSKLSRRRVTPSRMCENTLTSL